MNHLATMRIHDSSIDSWDAQRVRKRRRLLHVQKLRGRLSLPPESAKQDKRTGTRPVITLRTALRASARVPLNSMCRQDALPLHSVSNCFWPHTPDAQKARVKQLSNAPA